MTLKELLAANPDAKAEYDQSISAAKAEGEAAGKENMNKAFAAALPILSSAKYPDTVKARVTAKAQAGDVEGLADFVAMHDMNVQAAADAAAALESGVETPAQIAAAAAALSEDGSVSDAGQLAGAVAQHKEKFGTGGDNK